MSIAIDLSILEDMYLTLLTEPQLFDPKKKVFPNYFMVISFLICFYLFDHKIIVLRLNLVSIFRFEIFIRLFFISW